MNSINHFNATRACAWFPVKPLTLLMAIAFTSFAQAAPVGGVVAAGNASIGAAANTTTITQSSPQAIINWQGFNVAPNQTVHFIQPSSSAVILNRISSPDGTSILGTITANGKVFLLNPNGILFGQGSQVNVGGMVATTLGITDSNFMASNYHFSGAGNGAVVNQGTLRTNADAGYIALLGANVTNNGMISARLGTVAMAAGNAITLDIAGDHLLNVTVDQGTMNALVSNGNVIIADGGQVLMTARGAGSLLTNAVNNTGIIQAQSIENNQGSIILSAGPSSGTVNVSGLIDTSGNMGGQVGGSTQLLGGTVNIANAFINANGNAGGGQILIGGNFKGAGPQPNALFTNIDSLSTISANALQTGNGGRIAMWSDTATSVAGTISAKGGMQFGDGGYVETSGGKLTLASSALVNTQALNGKTGTWLLDPINWTIALSGGDETPAQVTTSLASSNVTITATNDISVNDPVSWSTAQALTLNAGHNVNINAAITASTAAAQVNLIAGNDALITGAITSSGAGNEINVTATRDITASGVITASSSTTQLNMTAGRNLTVGTVTTDGGGSMVLKANGNVTVDTASAAASPGSVTLIADNDGTGPGVAGGTVTVGTHITATNTIIRFNPASYATTNAEVAAYGVKIVGLKDIKAWVFVQANNKVYDGNTTDTMSFVGNPTDASAVTLNAGTATFNNKNVDTGKAVTYSGYTLGGTATNLALFAPYGTAAGAGTSIANITPLSLAVSATGTNKVYDGTTPDAVSVSLGSAPISGDVVNASYGAANFLNKNVGTAKTVNVTGITLTGADAGNYTTSPTTTTTANITAAPLTVSATGTNKAYDGNTTDAVTLSSNAYPTDSLTTSYGTANFANSAIGNNKPVSVVGITVTGADAGNYTYNTSASTTANITSTVTASNGNSAAIVPVLTPAIDNPAPVALQDDAHDGITPPPIVSPTLMGLSASDNAVATNSNHLIPITAFPLIGGMTAFNPRMVTVVQATPVNQLQSLFPPLVVAPVYIPKQGRN